MCPLRQQQQRIAQLMWAYKFTYVSLALPHCLSRCWRVCVGAFFFFFFDFPIFTYPSAAISCRRLCAAALAVKIADCTPEKYSQNYSRARFNQKTHKLARTHTHSGSHAFDNSACKYATIFSLSICCVVFHF